MMHSNKKYLSQAITAAVLGLFITVVALKVYAHTGAEGIVKERMDAMDVMGKAMKQVGDMFKGQADFDAAAIQVAAGLLTKHAQEIPSLFPNNDASRNDKHSEALPVIWERKDRFDSLAGEMSRAAMSLAEMAQDGDRRAMRMQFAKTAKACSACHTAFRKPKE